MEKYYALLADKQYKHCKKWGEEFAQNNEELEPESLE